MLSSDRKTLIEHAFKPFVCKMIETAHRQTDIAYSEMDRWLEANHNFSRLDRNATGFLAGALMNSMWDGLKQERIPLLNVLLVRKNGRIAGPGASYYLGRYFRDQRFKLEDVRKHDCPMWNNYCAKARQQVYEYGGWNAVYSQLRDNGLLDKPLWKYDRPDW